METGSEGTTAPVTTGRSRKHMSWASRVALLALALTASFALPGLAHAAGPAATIDQCRNGTFASPAQCIDGAFQNGNLGGSNSHYREGDSVPFRALVTGLAAAGSAGNTLVIEYDTIEGGKHAYDYLTGYDRTSPDARPAHDVAGATAGNCYPIPLDTSISFALAGAAQATGCISIWNGTITHITYGLADPTGQRSVIVTFDATTDNAVVAWGGHVSSQLDWGTGNSASAISGSDYHMRLLAINTTTIGQQDRSMKADAIPPTPGLTTQASSATVKVGASVTDTATLVGDGSNLVTGSIQFQTCGPTAGIPTCDVSNSHNVGTPVAIGAGAVTSPAFTPPAAGRYCFRAVYIPDAAAPYSPTAHTDQEAECFTASIPVAHPAISIAKNPKSQSITTGGTATFTITVTNTGDVPLSNVQVTDAKAPNCAKAIGNLAAGATTSYTCALANVASSFTNSATVTGHPAVGADVSATDTAPVTVNAPPSTSTSTSTPTPAPRVVPTPPAPKIDLQITKADSPDPDVLGTQVKYLIVVKNNGPDTAHNVQMSDPLPSQVTFSSVSTTQGTCTGGQLVSCQLGTIANGASVTVTVFVKTNETGIVTNTATTVGTEVEINTANNTASTTTLVKGPFTPPAAPTGCYAVAVAPHSLTAGKRSTLVLSVHMLGKPAKNARVRVTGIGISKTSGPTNAQGIVRLSIKPAKPGILRFQPVAHKGCGVPRIGVIGAFTPPVTG